MGREIDLNLEPETVPEELRPLLGGFLARRLSDVCLLRESLQRDDFAAIRMVGHRLRGNSGSFGFPAMGVLGAHLEAAAEAQNYEETTRLVNHLELMVNRLQKTQS